MKRTLNSIDWVHIPQYSSYNHNYYINVRDGQIMLGVSDDDQWTDYHLVTHEQMTITGGYGECIGFANEFTEFSIPSDHDRWMRTAKEWEFEFDSERC